MLYLFLYTSRRSVEVSDIFQDDFASAVFLSWCGTCEMLDNKVPQAFAGKRAIFSLLYVGRMSDELEQNGHPTIAISVRSLLSILARHSCRPRCVDFLFELDFCVDFSLSLGVVS